MTEGLSNSSGQLRELRLEHQALAILQILEMEPFNGTANDRLLTGCLELIALEGSVDQVRTVLLKLEEKGLIRSKSVDEYLVVGITEEGIRVAAGKSRAEGVAMALPR